MALPLGKLTILIGAGVLGSILAKEGRIPGVSDVISGALKIALKPITQNDTAPVSTKPQNDALIAQVNSLRQELQLLASNRPVTIVTSSRAGDRRFGVIIVIVVLGYGYVWWKGWKLPDFMFATKRSLTDACNSVSNELDKVFHSVRVTKNELSSTLDESKCKYDEIVECSTTTKDEVTDVSGKISKVSENIRSVNDQIRTLETKMVKIQANQDDTTEGVGRLLLFTKDADIRLNGAIQDSPTSSSRPALEYPRVAISSKSVSLPAALPLDLPSPSASNGSSEMNSHLRSVSLPSPIVSNGNGASQITEYTPVASPRQPVRTARFLSRTISATRNFTFGYCIWRKKVSMTALCRKCLRKACMAWHGKR